MIDRSEGAQRLRRGRRRNVGRIWCGILGALTVRPCSSGFPGDRARAIWDFLGPMHLLVVAGGVKRGGVDAEAGHPRIAGVLEGVSAKQGIPETAIASVSESAQWFGPGRMGKMLHSVGSNGRLASSIAAIYQPCDAATVPVTGPAKRRTFGFATNHLKVRVFTSTNFPSLEPKPEFYYAFAPGHSVFTNTHSSYLAPRRGILPIST